jgi:uncharacterized protein (TIGR03067 family)
MRANWLLGLLAVGLIAAAPQENKEKTDQDLIQGTWKVTEAESDGMQQPQQLLDNFKLTFKGDKAIPEGSGPGAKEATFKLETDKKPRQIHITPMEAGGPPKVVGLYEINGDTLKLCFRRTDSTEPPSEFSGKAGSGNVHMVLKRQK